MTQLAAELSSLVFVWNQVSGYPVAEKVELKTIERCNEEMRLEVSS